MLASWNRCVHLCLVINPLFLPQWAQGVCGEFWVHPVSSRVPAPDHECHLHRTGEGHLECYSLPPHTTRFGTEEPQHCSHTILEQGEQGVRAQIWDQGNCLRQQFPGPLECGIAQLPLWACSFPANIPHMKPHTIMWSFRPTSSLQPFWSCLIILSMAYLTSTDN